MIKLVNTVVFIAINEQNKVLLLKGLGERKEEEKKEVIIVKKNEAVNKEEWFIPVGNFGDDDDPRLIIKKEIKNQLGCEIGDCNYFNLYFTSISDNFIKKAVYFYGNLLGNTIVSKENTAPEWVDLEEDEIERLSLPQEQKEALIEFANFLQNKFMEEID
jgi:8-oxo-dGTP pyrophosphatase MutT (NUDIX family)